MIPGAFKLDHVYQERVGFTSAGAATEDVLDNILPPGQVLIATYVGVENRTSAYTRLLIGVKDGEVFHALFEQDSPAANNIYWMEHFIIAREGQRICARLTGATSGDVVIMEIQGYYGRIEVERL
jgi:hypothetical protein